VHSIICPYTNSFAQRAGAPSKFSNSTRLICAQLVFDLAFEIVIMNKKNPAENIDILQSIFTILNEAYEISLVEPDEYVYKLMTFYKFKWNQFLGNCFESLVGKSSAIGRENISRGLQLYYLSEAIKVWQLLNKLKFYGSGGGILNRFDEPANILDHIGIAKCMDGNEIEGLRAFNESILLRGSYYAINHQQSLHINMTDAHPAAGSLINTEYSRKMAIDCQSGQESIPECQMTAIFNDLPNYTVGSLLDYSTTFQNAATCSSKLDLSLTKSYLEQSYLVLQQSPYSNQELFLRELSKIRRKNDDVLAEIQLKKRESHEQKYCNL